MKIDHALSYYVYEMPFDAYTFMLRLAAEFRDNLCLIDYEEIDTKPYDMDFEEQRAKAYFREATIKIITKENKSKWWIFFEPKIIYVRFEKYGSIQVSTSKISRPQITDLPSNELEEISKIIHDFLKSKKGFVGNLEVEPPTPQPKEGKKKK